MIGSIDEITPEPAQWPNGISDLALCQAHKKILNILDLATMVPDLLVHLGGRRLEFVLEGGKVGCTQLVVLCAVPPRIDPKSKQDTDDDYQSFDQESR